jgi:glycosyltransferase involved in cell wall biosynthesis
VKISIITVTYNVAGVLEKTLQSIFSQTSKDFECLIIDGASTDGTLDIIRKYENEFAEFANQMSANSNSQQAILRYISEKDKGLYDAMNKGISLAKGEYIWFINAGDKIYAPTTITQILQELEKNPQADVVYGQSLIIDENDNPLGERHKIAPKNLKTKSLLNGLVVCHQSILVRRNIAPVYDLQYKISADYNWTIEVLKKSCQNLYIDTYLSKFMISGVSAKYRKQSLKERYRIMKKYFGSIPTLWAHLKIAIKYPFSRKYF